MKRIALGLFLGGMAVCTANAADIRAVASKGYVDSIAGSLSLLSTRDKTSLVAAINELFSGFDAFLTNRTQTIDANSTATQYPSAKAVYDAIQNTHDTLDLGEVGTEGKFIQFLRQDNGKVIASATAFDTVINDETKLHEGTAPTTKAVYDAIEDVRGDIPTNVQTAIADGEYSTTTGFFNKVKQTNGKVSVEEKAFDIVVDDTTGRNTDTAPTTQAVHQALWKKQDKSNADYQIGMANGVWQTLIPEEIAALQSGISLDKVADYDEYATSKQNAFDDGADVTATNGFISGVKQDNGTVTAVAMAFDTVINDETKLHEGTALTTKAVADAMSGKVDLNQGVDNKHRVMVTDAEGKVIPAPLAECSDLSSKCVLTYGAEGYGWEVIARGNGN